MRFLGIAALAATVAVVAAAFLIGPVDSDVPTPALPEATAPSEGTPAEGAAAERTPASAPQSTPPVVQPPVLRAAPALLHLDGWLQSEVTSLEELRGDVVIVQFWTFGCHNCKATLPHLQDIYANYHERGLEIVGVHAPEFGYEKDPDAIAAAAEELGVTWPIALDTNRRDFRRWQGSPAYWPRTYVLDREGQIRFDHIGEGAYDQLEQTVSVLLGASSG